MFLKIYKKYFYKTITFVIIFCCFAWRAFADDLSPKITSIKQGQIAPFDGVLLNTPAAAKVFVQKDFSLEECQLKIDFEVEKEKDRLEEALDHLNNSRNFEQKRYELLIGQKDEENKKLLEEITQEHTDYSLYWFAGGTALGIALTIGIGFAVADLND